MRYSHEQLVMSEKDIERFFRFYSSDADYHGLWSGAVNKHGYGMFWMAHGLNRMVEAYVVAYHSFVGEVDEGLELCHTVEGDKCANWAHVRPGTHDSNMYAHHGSTEDRCVHNHLREVYWRPKTASSPARCLACFRMRNCLNRGVLLEDICPECGLIVKKTDRGGGGGCKGHQ
jgi:hypothetical protein